MDNTYHDGTFLKFLYNVVDRQDFLRRATRDLCFNMIVSLPTVHGIQARR